MAAARKCIVVEDYHVQLGYEIDGAVAATQAYVAKEGHAIVGLLLTSIVVVTTRVVNCYCTPISSVVCCASECGMGCGMGSNRRNKKVIRDLKQKGKG